MRIREHPLKDVEFGKKNKHSIFYMEQELTVREMIGYCKGKVHVYLNKDKETSKSNCFHAKKYLYYKNDLELIPKRYLDIIVERALKYMRYEYNYKKQEKKNEI